jgi:hypothetical protein
MLKNAADREGEKVTVPDGASTPRLVGRLAGDGVWEGQR